MLRALSSFTLLLSFVSAAPAQDRTAWYREAKFGMFVHWGPYSLASVEASWPIMTPRPGGITEAEYRALPARFNPARFDPDAWVKLARAAGQRYIVFTSKHHDGFAMFDSAFTKNKITKTPYGKDIAAQLAEACRKAKMPLGFYYSPPDMSHTGFRDTTQPASANWQGEPERPEWATYIVYMEMQLRELLTRYGDVAILWFDGLGNQRQYDGLRFHRLIHELQPATLINNRIGVPGDYDTPEQFIPKRIPTRSGARFGGTERPEEAGQPEIPPAAEEFRLWETCMTINDTWAYNANDRHYKSAAELIRALVEVASKGGNFLLNVGPGPDGAIQPEFQERLLAVGAWLQRNGEAIYGTTWGPLQDLKFGRTTAKGKTVYLHIFDWPNNGQLEVGGLKTSVTAASLLGGRQRIPFSRKNGNLILRLPAQAPDATVSVVALETR